MGRLEELPEGVLLIICGKLDARSLLFLESSCRSLHAFISPLLLQLPVLHILDTALPSTVLKRYMETNTTLHTLAIDCSQLAEEDALLLLKPQLRRLHLKNCFHISQESRFYVHISQLCVNLRSLSLDLFWLEHWQMVDRYVQDMETLISSLRSLESLSLQGRGTNLDGEVLGKLPKVLGPSIKALRIVHMAENDARRLSNVKWIAANSSSVAPSVRVVGCKNLERLSLVVSVITDTLLSILTVDLVCLTELDLEDDPPEVPRADLDLSNWGIQQVANCKNLRKLSLVRAKVTSWRRGQFPSFRRVNDLGFLLMAQSCKNLESIRLGRFSQVTDTGLHSLLESCARLRTFELIGMKQITDLTFHNMAASSSHSLVLVSLPAANRITCEAMVQLASCSCLKFLNLALCRSVGDEGLKAMADFTKLSVLDLSGLDISDSGLVSLSKSSSPLMSLSLRGCKRLTHTGICALVQGSLPATLKALDLSNIPGVTDETVVALIRSGMQIIDLRLRDCRAITDASVAALAAMEYEGSYGGGSLRVLDLLDNAGLTLGALDWFQKPYFPWLRWVGLGRHLEYACAIALLREQRGSVQFSFEASPDACFGYDALWAKHSDHWCEEEGGYGAAREKYCELCAAGV